MLATVPSVSPAATLNSMWTDLIQKAKDGGLDIIQMYVFWNGHVPSPGKIENEYGPMEYEIGGKAFTEWATKMVVGLGTIVPWIMCEQDDAPDPICRSLNINEDLGQIRYIFSDKTGSLPPSPKSRTSHGKSPKLRTLM